MGGARADIWIKSAASPEEFLDHIGKHMVAHPLGDAEHAFGGQFIALTPEHETVSLRRYDTGEIREFPWFTTNFKVSVYVGSPFTALAVGMIRRFEWWQDDNDQALIIPRSLLGTVDTVTADEVTLWVRDPACPGGGWWARIKAGDAARHSIRPPIARQPGE